jgi:5-(carboxyamino)imidazole ribonucleotide synthase
VHSYGKAVRPGRKIGHVNALSFPGDDVATVRRRAETVAAMLRDGVPSPVSPSAPSAVSASPAATASPESEPA